MKRINLFIGISIFLFVNYAIAQNTFLPDSVTRKIDADTERLTAIFKDIHANPELGFMEVRTAGIVEKELKKLGYKVITGIAQTGVVGIMENGPGPVVMFRADMDANAVKELTGLSYASTKVATRKDDAGQSEEVPVMHACGHDAHVTWLIGIARVMAENKDLWSGTLVLVAQPAEEITQGAKAMVKDNMYQRGVPKPDYLLGLHTTPAPTGMVSVTAGDVNAGTDQFDVTFHGIGGHGSSPHLTKDPVVMAAAAIMQYQVIVGRGINPLDAAVITVGSIQAGTDNNVIPESALLKLNIRWYNEEDRKLMLNGIDRVNQSIASAYGLPDNLRPTIFMKGGAKVLTNDAEMAKKVASTLKAQLGEKAVITAMPKLMGSEDVHHLVLDNEKHRYLYMYMGTAKPAHVEQANKEGKLVPYSNHNPDYQVDLDAIPLGVKVGTSSILTFMGKEGN